MTRCSCCSRPPTISRCACWPATSCTRRSSSPAELEADLLRVTDRYAAASERYRDLLVEWPRRVQSRIGLADAYRRLGFAREADETLAQARQLWASADAEAKAQIK